MEAGDVDTVIKDPQHPYTRLLVDSIPWPNLDQRWGAHAITPREGGGIGTGCPFMNRCPAAMDICKTYPPFFKMDDHHTASCYLHAAYPKIAPERLSELLPA